MESSLDQKFGRASDRILQMSGLYNLLKVRFYSGTSAAYTNPTILHGTSHIDESYKFYSNIVVKVQFDGDSIR